MTDAIVPSSQTSLVKYSDVLSHPDVSRLVNSASMHVYFQLAVKIVVTVIALSLFFIGFRHISEDIRNEQQKLLEDEHIETQKCKTQWDENRCDQPPIPPALVNFCKQQEDCMHYQPTAVPKSRIAARYIASLLNELVSELSVKTLGVLAVIFAVAIWIPKFN
jgi:hypothetical protein